MEPLNIKFLVVDSLSRSGTTLFSAVLRSQEKTAIFCPGFNEPLSCMKEGWPDHHTDRSFETDLLKIDMAEYKKETLKYIKSHNQLYNFTFKDISQIILEGETPDQIITNIANLLNTELLGFRWNQGLWYFNNWTSRSPKHLWLGMIRNPIDRAVSAAQKHEKPVSRSLSDLIAYGTKIEKILDHKQFYLIYYEDLINHPYETIESFYEFLNIKITDINIQNLLGSNNKPFIPQPSGLKTEIKDGYCVGGVFSGFYNTKIGRHKKEMNENLITEFKKAMAPFKVYERYL